MFGELDGVTSGSCPPSIDDGAQEHPIEFAYAGFARRLAAFALDFIVYVILQLGLGIVLLILLMPFPNLSEPSVDKMLMIFGVLIMWLYYALMEASGQQATVGKKLLGILVVDLQCNRIGFWRATMRHFAKIFSSLFFFLGFFIIDYTKQKQGMHDMMARTLVIKRPGALVTRSE